MVVYVYEIRHIESGRSYVGKSRYPLTSWQTHERSWFVRQHGVDAFEWIVAGQFETEEEAFSYECELIEARRRGAGVYNVASGRHADPRKMSAPHSFSFNERMRVCLIRAAVAEIEARGRTFSCTELVNEALLEYLERRGHTLPHELQRDPLNGHRWLP